MIEKWVCLNGRIVSTDNAKVSIMDRICLYGDGLFETFRVYDGKIFAMDEHLARLKQGFASLYFNDVPQMEVLREALMSLCEINGISNGSIRLTISRGLMGNQLTPGEDAKACYFATCKKGLSYGENWYKQGITAMVSSVRRNEYSPLSKVKSINFLDNILAKIEGEKEGAQESILLNTKGYVAEGSVSNIFIINENTIITPHEDSGVLPGVTRNIILNLLSKNNSFRDRFNMGAVNVQRKAVKEIELFDAKEVFLTNSLMEVMPVVKIGQLRVGSGLVGSITKKIHSMFRYYVAENI